MHSREQLFHVLAEAAELEHNLLCSYLYAAFSLKQDAAEDLTPPELEAVERWRATLMQVCIEEMVHLAQVSNLLVAVGARPHFNRPNLPVPPGYHPAGIVIELAPLSLQTIDHFIFLERPEDAPLADPLQSCGDGDGDGNGSNEADQTASARSSSPKLQLMPAAPDYRTVGEFYAYIKQGLGDLARQIGEPGLFCGDHAHQLRGAEMNAPELIVVTDLRSAQGAIDFIVEQGEGSPADRGDSHFQRFQAVKAECLALTAARPGFCAHRPAARNPVMRPPTESVRVHVTAPAAVAVLDAANAAYGAMLRCLVDLYELPSTQSAPRAAVLGAAIGLMKALAVLASHLTRLPATSDAGDTGARSSSSNSIRAGVSFAMLRSTEGLRSAPGATGLLAERLTQIAEQIACISLPREAADQLAAALGGLGQQLRSDA